MAEIDLYHCTWDVQHPDKEKFPNLSGILRCHLQEWKHCYFCWDTLAKMGHVYESDNSIEFTDLKQLEQQCRTTKEGVCEIFEMSEDDVMTFCKEHQDDHISKEHSHSLCELIGLDCPCTYIDVFMTIEFLNDILCWLDTYPAKDEYFYEFRFTY